MGNDLSVLERAANQLATITDFPSLLDIRDKAEAVRCYTKAAGNGLVAQNQAARIKLLAEMRVGELLKEMQKAGSLSVGRPKKGSSERPFLSLSDLGLTRTKSATYQRESLLPKDKFESLVSKCAESGTELTQKLVINTVKALKKETDKRTRAASTRRARERLTKEARDSISSVCDIRHCSMSDLLRSIKPDAIITDPPYPKEFLHVYGEMAELSREVPLVAVMCGQSYLPEIVAAMSAHLKYRWTLAYLTPGGQAVQQWQAKVNTFWKPILLFGEAADDWIGDVCKSDTNDNDKRFHEWGQSESGMADLVERLTKPGQLICDPFLGGGTTAVVAFRLGRRFVGCDLEKECCDKATSRIEELQCLK